MKKLKKYVVFFSVGGAGYAAIELLWRGRTHWTMIIAGGICFLIFSAIAERFKSKPLAYRILLCTTAATAVELVFGIIFNIIFKMNVWNYSDLPLNLFGQICPRYTLLWSGLSLLILPLANTMNKRFNTAR